MIESAAAPWLLCLDSLSKWSNINMLRVTIWNKVITRKHFKDIIVVMWGEIIKCKSRKVLKFLNCLLMCSLLKLQIFSCWTVFFKVKGDGSALACKNSVDKNEMLNYIIQASLVLAPMNRYTSNTQLGRSSHQFSIQALRHYQSIFRRLN